MDRGMTQTLSTSIANLYATVLGAILLLFGILGFFPVFGGPTGNEFGIFAINPLHNIVHIVTGIVGLAAGLSGRVTYARWYALVFGIVYALITIIGLIQGTTVLGIIPVNVADNILHLVIAVSALVVYFATRGEEITAPAA